MTIGFQDNTRALLIISGADSAKFLQDLITNDLGALTDGPVYAALLSPQGKYLFDFFLVAADGAILLDIAEPRAAALAQRLNMYRLRADVLIEQSDKKVWRGLGPAPQNAVFDPRHPAMGWRLYGTKAPPMDTLDQAAFLPLRIEHIIPKTGLELVENETYILEAGFERLNGVDFRKGCYVGQEITARMKHKTELKKGLVKVVISGIAPPAGTAVTQNGKPVGTLFSSHDGQGLAHLRFARATGDMQSGDAVLQLVAPNP